MKQVFSKIIQIRKYLSERYDMLLNDKIQRPKRQDCLEYNYSYYPVLFENEISLNEAFKKMAKKNIYPRRYFYPSLNELPYLKRMSCPIAEDISSRIACLPMYVGLEEKEIEMICDCL